MKSNEPEVVEKRRVAKASKIILVSEIFDRYSTAAISTIILLFLNLKLGYDKDASTAIYHTFEFVAYFFTIVGGAIADSWLGMWRTIVLTSTVFAVGAFIAGVATVDSLYLPIHAISIVCLVVLYVSGGCLKPLCSTFGALQYKPDENKSIALYFSLYYFMYNFGSITSRFISPILRQDVKCFGNDDCFALAFGIPGIFMILVGVLCTIANRYSVTSQMKGTTLLNVITCIWHAIVTKFKSRKSTQVKKPHWLDYSADKYGKKLVGETRVIINVIVLYLPIPIFWALFFQQGSRWVFQAVRMNGDIGFYTIKPDQFNVVNPLLVLILIPLLEYVIYAQLSKIGIRTALQKVALGMVFAGLAFLTSAVVESQIEMKLLHMGWLLPQYLLMAVGEILITIPLMHFSYAQAPSDMKTILQSLMMFTIGLGNLIVTVVAGSKLIESQMYEFILFAVLMFVDMIIFGLLARRYKTLDVNVHEQTDNK
ncbi:hypothetical protein HA402_005116 [Bradysia odoriphaga]|nr:hypothetical protein HA402_005116 [Bradysia odoriphaga]